MVASIESTQTTFPILHFYEFVISAIDELDKVLDKNINQGNSWNGSVNGQCVSDDRQALQDNKLKEIYNGDANIVSGLPGLSVGDRIEDI